MALIAPSSPALNLGNIAQKKDFNLPDGKDGNIATIEIMQRVAHQRAGEPIVRRLAENIIGHYGVRSHNYADEAKAIGDWVKKNVNYLQDATGIEQLTDPLTLISRIQSGNAYGDCDDMALLVATLLLSIGHRPFFRMVRYRSSNTSDNFNHIYVVVYDRNYKTIPVRIALDAIVKDRDIGFELPHMSGEEIEV